jgi:hypothetical protein
MQTAHDPDLDEVLDRERSLLTRPVRSDPDAVRRLLHPEFREFGASGRVWTASRWSRPSQLTPAMPTIEP